MARIRTIKPEFFTSEDIVALPPLARLLYIAMWCEADKAGRLAWKPKTFKMRYLPADSCDIEELCNQIVSAGLVRLYGDGLAFIPKFADHQHINPRETESKLPAPDASRTRRPRVSDAQGGREGKGKEGDSPVVDDATDNPAPPPVITIPLVDGSEFEVSPSKAAEWSAAFPGVNVPQKLAQMRVWCIANPSKRKTRRGVETFIVSWLGRDQDSGKGGGAPSQTGLQLAGAI